MHKSALVLFFISFCVSESTCREVTAELLNVFLPLSFSMVFFFFFLKRSLTEHSEFCSVSGQQASEICLFQFLAMLELQKMDTASSFPNQELRQ